MHLFCDIGSPPRDSVGGGGKELIVVFCCSPIEKGQVNSRSDKTLGLKDETTTALVNYHAI
jgi:hypothetical protein